jgi:hypothetical protein
MLCSDGYIRIRKYFRKHGLRKTICRFVSLIEQRLFLTRQVVFWLDLAAWSLDPNPDDKMYSVEKIEDRNQLPEALYTRLGQEHAEELIERHLTRRFAKHATLWSLKRQSEFLGYTWTLASGTLKPYFFPLTARDVHIFDNLIFAQFRGKRLNCVLMRHVLAALKAAEFQRAYIETGEWNDAELRSLDRIGFVRIGCGTRRSRQRRHIVTWWFLERPQRAETVDRLPHRGDAEA